MNAWAVAPYNRDEEHGWDVFFAETEAEALQCAADKEGVEPSCFDSQRAEWADEFAPGPVPASAWLNAGWTIGCSNCEIVVDWDEEPPIIDGHDVYCSPNCRRAMRALRRQQREAIRRALKRLGTVAPGVEIRSACYGRLGHCDSKHEMAGIISFRVAGMRDYADYCHACRVSWFQEGDVAAWEARRR